MFSKLCTKIWLLKDNLKEDARGVSALEYAILIAIVIGALMFFFGSDSSPLKNIFENAQGKLSEASSAGKYE